MPMHQILLRRTSVTAAQGSEYLSEALALVINSLSHSNIDLEVYRLVTLSKYVPSWSFRDMLR